MEIRPIVSALLRSKTGAVLIAAQVALTLAIVVNALFVVEARLATAARPSGADEADVFQVRFLGISRIADRKAMRDRDLETLRAIPGVVSASETNQMPLSQGGWGLTLSLDPKKPAEAMGGAAYFAGGPLIDTLGLKLVAGRDFRPEEIKDLDSEKDEPTAELIILTQALATKIYGDEPAVGKTLWFGAGPKATPMQVIGVVETLMSPWAQRNDEAYESFILPVRWLTNMANYAVRVEPGQLDRVMTEADAALGALRHDRVKLDHRSMEEIRERRYSHEKAGAGMLVAVTLGLLVVTASGIVGVATLWVNQRRKQIGVRRALGARRLDILRYFLTENFLITSTGVVAGVGLAIGLNQFLVSKVELARLPFAYVGAGMAALWILGLVAVLGPAWRAAAVPPAVATRST
jgi:putative ABC transport system permease protein